MLIGSIDEYTQRSREPPSLTLWWVLFMIHAENRAHRVLSVSADPFLQPDMRLSLPWNDDDGAMRYDPRILDDHKALFVFWGQHNPRHTIRSHFSVEMYFWCCCARFTRIILQLHCAIATFVSAGVSHHTESAPRHIQSFEVNLCAESWTRAKNNVDHIYILDAVIIRLYKDTRSVGRSDSTWVKHDRHVFEASTTKKWSKVTTWRALNKSPLMCGDYHINCVNVSTQNP